MQTRRKFTRGRSRGVWNFVYIRATSLFVLLKKKNIHRDYKTGMCGTIFKSNIKYSKKDQREGMS